MKKNLILLLVSISLILSTTPVFAAEDSSETEQTTEIKKYTLEVPLQSKGNYFTSIVDENSIMTLEVLDPADESEPIDIKNINTRALGNEEFAPGTYTRTLRYYEKITNGQEFIASWQVKFTIYSDSTYPKITYVSGLTQTNFPSVTAPSIKRAQATSSSAAYAYAYAQNTVQTWDRYVRLLDMTYSLYKDDSGTASVDMTKYAR